MSSSAERMRRLRQRRRMEQAPVPELVAPRDLLRVQQRQPSSATLAGYAIEQIARDQALPLIMAHEWLGNVGRATIFVALVSPSRELHGVVCFGHGPGRIRRRIGSPALCVERGACTPDAPANAASFLISQACRLVHRMTGVDVFFAYADPMAGEYGSVYQACGWAYLGQGIGGTASREHRTYVLPPGADPNNPAAWRTARDLRRNGRWLTHDEARALGWKVARRAAKHVYATHVGRDRKAWRKSIGEQPYPSPRPERKRVAAANDNQRLAVPPACAPTEAAD